MIIGATVIKTKTLVRRLEFGLSTNVPSINILFIRALGWLIHLTLSDPFFKASIKDLFIFSHFPILLTFSFIYIYI